MLVSFNEFQMIYIISLHHEQPEKAICNPAMTTKRGWMYRYDWKLDDADKHPPKLEYDKNKPDEAQVSRLKEGIHIISVSVSCSKRSEIVGDNEEENIGCVTKCVSAKITVKSGNSVQNSIYDNINLT